jgi:hypothetical protein
MQNMRGQIELQYISHKRLNVKNRENVMRVFLAVHASRRGSPWPSYYTN